MTRSAQKIRAPVEKVLASSRGLQWSDDLLPGAAEKVDASDRKIDATDKKVDGPRKKIGATKENGG
jgi:hypothetical protein